jgi:hypothetical protein
MDAASGSELLLGKLAGAAQIGEDAIEPGT